MALHLSDNGYQICGHQGGPDVTLERAQALPCALVKTKASLQPGDPGLDPCPEASESGVDILASAHVRDLEAAPFGKANILDPLGLGCGEIGLRCKPTVQRHLEGIAVEYALLAVDHVDGQVAVRRVAPGDDAIRDQTGVTAAQADLMTVIGIPGGP